MWLDNDGLAGRTWRCRFFLVCYAEVGEIEEDIQTFTVTRIPITFHLKASFDEKQRKKFEHIALKTCFVGNTLTAKKDFTFVL